MFRRLTQTRLATAIGKLSLLVPMAAVLVLFAPLISAAETPKKILIFSGTDPNLPTVIQVSQILRSTLEKSVTGRVQFYSESLDNHRIPEDKYEQEMVKLLQRKYEGEKIDLIFTLGSSGLTFLLKHKEEIFSNTPKVFIHTDEHEGEGLDLGPNVTGVQGGIELRSALDLALSLHPGTRRVVVVTGSSNIDRFRESLARKEFQSYGSNVEFSYLSSLTVEALRKDLGSLPQGTIVLFLSFLADPAGNGYSLPESVSLVAPSSSAPIYVVIQSAFRPGVVGGLMISYDALGKAGADLGLRVLAGERPQDITPQTVRSVAMFDWREFRRWRIDESRLPAGSIVLYKEFSVWELYKWRIIGVVTLVIFEAILIVGLLISRARRRQAERDSERLARVAEGERRRLDEVVSNVPGIVWETRLESGTNQRQATFVSEYVEKMLGYTREEWLSTPGFALTIISEEDREQTVREVQALLESGKEGVLQFRWTTKDGGVIWVQSQVAPVCDETGKAVGLRGVTMDITDRKEAEEALLRAHEQVSKLKNQLQEENVYLQEEIKLAHNVDEIIGRSNAIKYVLFKIEQVCQTDSTVMILGETGTGKELVARAIHSQSSRKDRPLVKVNCAALSANLIESELFGHEKGSFTGASARKIGRFELADGATLFLDEIGELPLDLQSKLLRVIQEGEFERLGSSKTTRVDVRIIAATNRNMKTEVEKGAFREDLWYRLNVFPITVPPLRQRMEDIPPMVEHFVNSFSRKVGKTITAVSSATLKKLQDYSWPGNVRELANVIERGVINAQSPVLHIVDQFEQVKLSQPTGASKTLDEIEKEYISRILDDTAGRIEGPKGAAKILGLNPSTLRTRMVKLGIQKSARSSA